MFPYMQSIALFQVCVALFELYLSLRQRKNYLVTDMQSELSGFIPKEKFESAQAYGKDMITFSIILSIIRTAINLVMYFTFFMARMWDVSLQIMTYVNPKYGKSHTPSQ